LGKRNRETEEREENGANLKVKEEVIEDEEQLQKKTIKKRHAERDDIRKTKRLRTATVKVSNI